MSESEWGYCWISVTHEGVRNKACMMAARSCVSVTCNKLLCTRFTSYCADSTYWAVTMETITRLSVRFLNLAFWLISSGKLRDSPCDQSESRIQQRRGVGKENVLYVFRIVDDVILPAALQETQQSNGRRRIRARLKRNHMAGWGSFTQRKEVCENYKPALGRLRHTGHLIVTFPWLSLGQVCLMCAWAWNNVHSSQDGIRLWTFQ